MAHILVADDEPCIRQLLKQCLVKAGHSVTLAADGREALVLIAEQKPDIVFLDVMMPRLDGFELLTRLKQDPGTAEIPVIMLTAKAQDADVMEGWKRGVHVYLTKPFNPMELLTFTRRIFDTIEAPADGRIRL